MGKKNKSSLDSLIDSVQEGQVNPQTGLAQVQPPKGMSLDDIISQASHEDKTLATSLARGVGNERQASGLTKQPWDFADHSQAYKRRADEQPWYEQTGNSISRFIPKIIYGVAEKAGYIFDLKAHMDTMTGVGNDYSNFMTEFAQNGKKAIDERFPIYRQNPGKTFDLSDWAWWVENGEGLATSIGEFAVTGFGVGSILGKGASILASIMKASAKTAGLLTEAATALTAAELAYVEGAMGGAQVYKDIFSQAINDGVSPEIAREKAGKAASITVQFNTLVNTGLNVTSAKMFIRPMSSTSALDNALAREAGESMSAWRARVASTAAQSESQLSLGTVASEMSQESLEEIVNELSNTIGTYKGKESLSKLSAEEKRNGLTGEILKTLGKDSTALAAILGAVGGGGQKLVTSLLPSSKERVRLEKDYQQKQLDYLVSRIDSFQTAQQKMSDAIKNKDQARYEQARDEVFTTEAMSSFVNGTQDQIRSMYQEIANLSPDEAEKQGYDISNGPDNYKRRAVEAVSDINKLSDSYNDIVNRYNAYDAEANATGYGENVFARHLNKFNFEKRIDRAQERLDRSKAEFEKNLARRGTDLGITDAIYIQDNIKSIDQAVVKSAQEISDLNNMSDAVMSQKYGMPPTGTSTKQHAIDTIKSRVERMKARQVSLGKNLEKAKADFIEIGNKASDFNDVINNTTFERDTIREAQSDIETARESLKDLDKDYKSFISKDGRDKFVNETLKDNARQRSEDEANEKKAKGEKKAQQDSETRDSIKKETRDKARETGVTVPTETGTAPVEQQVVQAEKANQPEVQEPQEVSKEVVKAGIAISEETRPEEAKEDGDTSNLPNKVRSKGEELNKNTSISDYLIVDAANSFAYLSKNYSEVDGTKVTTTNEKNAKLVRELESSTAFQPGDSIELVVDKTVNWTDKDGGTWKYEDFIKADGTVDINNVPISIKKDGETVAFIRTNKWILQQDAIGQYTNVADSTDPEHVNYGNAKRQAELNSQLRKAIVKGGPITTTITSKTAGKLSKNIIDGKEKKDTMSNLTPKVSTFTVVKNGQFHTNKNDIYTDKALLNSSEFLKNLHDYNSVVFAELVAPNGEALMIPASIPTLSAEQAHTVYATLLAKFIGLDSVRTGIFEQTDLDVTTDSGILEFLRLYTHTLDESTERFKQRVDGEGPANARHLNYSTKTGILSYARHNREVVVIATKQDLQENKQDILNFLKEKLFSVRLSKINTNEAISEPVIDEKDNLTVNDFKSYNDYIKSRLLTNIKGSEISETEDTYFDQPVIEFSTSFVDSTPAEKTAEVAETTPGENIEEDTDLLGDIDSIMGIDSSIDYDGKENTTYDFEMTDEQRAMIKKGLESFLVVDSQTGTPYNAYAQLQVVDSILEVVVRDMQRGSKSSKAFDTANRVFKQREKLYKQAELKYKHLTADQKAKLAIESVDDAQELRDEFAKVLRNWTAFTRQTQTKLAAIFGIKETINDTRTEEEAFESLDGFEELESALEKVSFDDGATFQTNHKDTASARLKLFLALQESNKRSFLNLKIFMPFDTVYDELQMLLAGTDPTYDNFIQKLYLVGANKPYVQNLITKLDNQPQQVRNEFVVAFSKQYNPFFVTLWGKQKKRGSEFIQMQNIESNRNDVIKRVESQWIEDQKSSPIVKSSNGKLLIDNVKAEEFKNKVDELAIDPTVDGTRELLKMIGITMPSEAIVYLKDNSVKLTGKTFEQNFKSGMFKHMAESLVRSHDDSIKGDVESLLDLNNPLTGIDREGSSIKILATLTAEFSNSVYSNSHRDSEGKTIYSYSLNTHLSHTMRRLTENNGDNVTINGLSKISFSKYSHWLNEIKHNSKFRENFSLRYLDGLVKRYSNQKGIKRNDQSDREMELQAMALFQNQGREQANFIYPTISDKITTPVITALKHDISVLINEDGSYSLGRATKRLISNLVRAEIDRIENYKRSTDKIKGYDDGGATKFFLFPGMNELVEGKILPNGKIPVELQGELFLIAERHVKDLVDSTIKTWEDLGIKTKENVLFDKSYLGHVKTKIKNASTEDIALYGALDMEINYLVANANIMQLVAGDPALHYKKNIETTLVEYTKRLAKDIAPGLDGNFDKPKYSVVYLADKNIDTNLLSEYKKIIGDKASAYTNIEGTDAQELTTLREHLTVMQAYGKISDEDFLRFRKMNRENKSFSGKELDLILQPMKPVQVGNDIDFERDVNKINYIKSSSYPLIPQLTKGLEIDKLRQQMELHKVDRAAYVSAAKLGATKIVKLWDGNVVDAEFSLKDKSVVLDRSNFRIQQEVPYKEDKTKILTVSQMNKLLFEGILEIEGMKELKDRKEEIRKQLFTQGKDKLLKKIGATINDNDEIIFNDLNKLKTILAEEAKDRGYPLNDIQSLELTEDKKSFRIPLSFNASSKKFESLLMSLITNNVLKQKISGKSYVQGSSAGFLTDQTVSKRWSELSNKELGGIVYTSGINMDKGLQFIRKEDNVVKGAQLLVPFYFRDSKGKPLNISDYTKIEDGKTIIDPDKIDSELLRMIGARIPNQGHSSMLPIEIAGFLPESMGDLVIVPDEITKQMGSDFDVDKLYTYQYEYTISNNGSLNKILSTLDEAKKAFLATGGTQGDIDKGYLDNNETSIKNEYVDIHWKVLTHPEVLPRILAPLDQKGEYSIAGEAALINGIRSKNAKEESFLYRRNQQRSFMQNKGGKSGVGIFSLASTFNSTIQDHDLFLGHYYDQKLIKDYINHFDGLSLHKLSGKGKSKIADKAAVISDMQSASVDNAKEQTLDKINLNDYTFAAANAIAQLETEKGINPHIQYISRLMSQRVILDYVKEIEKLSDSTMDEFIIDKEAEAYKRVRDKYSVKAGETKVESLSPDSMLEMIKSETTPDQNWYAGQVKALDAFMNFNEIGKVLTNIQSSINSDSKGVSPNYFDVLTKIENIKNVSSNGKIRGVSSLLSKDSEVGLATAYGPFLAKQLTDKLLIQSDVTFSNILSSLAEDTGKDNFSSDNKNLIFDDYKSFLFTSNGLFVQDIDQARSALLIDNETPSLATRVRKAQSSWGKNNFLLRRLMAKFSDIKGDPATVEYVASAGERLDEQESIKAFIELLTSKNKEEYDLGQDLITYSYITAGTQGATNFMKFIPNMYLNARGFDAKLRDMGTSSVNVTTFKDQFIQHNPAFAPKMNEDMIKKVKGSEFTLPRIEEADKGLQDYVLILTHESGVEYLNYPTFLQYREDNKFKLFRNNGKNDKGETIFTQVDTLGGKRGISEYNLNATTAKSYYKENQSNAKKTTSMVPQTSPSAKNNNPNASTNALAKYGLSKSGGSKKDVIEAIKIIREKSNNPANRLLADIIYSNRDVLPEIRFEINNDLESAGRYAYGVIDGKMYRSIVINISKRLNQDGTLNTEEFETLLLHEVIHWNTSEIMQAYEDGIELPAGIKASIKSIDAIRSLLINKLTPNEKKVMAEFHASKDKANYPISKDSRRYYYALMNSKEFVTMVLTEKVVQERLNEIPFTGKMTLLERFIEVLTKMYTALAESLGVEVKSGSVLEAAINETVSLLDQVKNIDENVSGSDEAVVFNGDRYILTNEDLKKIRSEFGLINEAGKPTKLTFDSASKKAQALNNTNERFKQEYGKYYSAYATKILDSSGKIYWNVNFEVKQTLDMSENFDEASSIDPSIKKIIDRLEVRKDNIKRAMSESKEDKVIYQDKIDALDQQIEKLAEENSLKELSSVAKIQLDWVSNILDHANVSLSELKEAQNAINVWGDVKKLFREDYSGKYQEVLSDISNRAEDLDIKWKELAEKVILKETQKTSKRDVKLDDLRIMVDVKSPRANLLDLSRIDNPAVQALDTWLKDAARDTNAEFTSLEELITKQFDALKETPEFKKSKFDIFLQKDSVGKWTGGLVNRFSQEWYDENKKQSKLRDRKKDDPQSWKRYFKWKRDNEFIIDSRLLFDEEGNKNKDSVADKHISEVIEEFGEERANILIDRAQAKYKEYLLDLDAFTIGLEADRDLNPEMTQEEYDSRLLKWKIENSPKNYISNYKGQAIVKGIKMRGYRYTVAQPRKFIDGKRTKWYDNSFEHIEKTPALLEFYNFYRDTMATMLNELPTYEIKDLQANFIPSIKKSLLERFTDSGMRGAGAGLYENFVEAISSEERGAVSADRDMRSGDINKRIPIRFIQDETENTDKSKDLIKALELFSMMSLNYKYKSRIEDKVLIMQRLINESIEQQLNSKNEIQYDTKGNLYQTTDGLVNLKKMAKHTIDYSLYNERRNEGSPTGVVVAGSIRDSARATKLAKQIKDLNTKYKLGNMSKELFDQAVEPLQKELTELGGRNVTSVDIADFTMKVTQLKGMAFNIFSAGNNLSFGLISNIIHAAGGEDFSIKDAAKAYKIMLTSTSKSLGLDRLGIGKENSHKISALMSKFDILFEVNESAYNGNSKKRKNALARVTPYELQKRSEYFIQGMNLVARMLHEKVKTLDGKETSLFEAFDSKGEWRADIYGPNTGWSGDIAKQDEMQDFRTFRNRLIQLNKRIHGNYDPNSFPLAKRAIFGRFLLQFRSWLAESVAMRFEPEQWDEQLGRNVKGMYRTIGDIGPMETLRSYFKIAMMKKDGLSNLSPVDQANLRRSFIEVAFMMGVMAMGITLAGMSDDDDDDKKVRNLLLNQIYRLESDLTFYTSPSSFNKILSNPVPAIRTYLDAEKAIKSTGQYFMQDSEMDGRKALSTEDVFLKWLKAFPFLNQYPKLKTQQEKVF